tara:strand:+ start:265 stop:537 length:273 start_codon:yes stop_codon:yes gene_type:complete
MTRIIKTISLDDETNKIAQSLPNFSMFVRAKLLELEAKKATRGYFWRCECAVRDFRKNGKPPRLTPYCPECNQEMVEITNGQYLALIGGN